MKGNIHNIIQKEVVTMSETETSEDSWDGLLSNFLKAENLKSDKEEFVCIGLTVDGKDMDLELERKDRKYIFSLNVTNKLFLKNNGIEFPKQVIGRVIVVKKVLATNPTSKKEVESLRICEIKKVD
jgi:hypothetical protein